MASENAQKHGRSHRALLDPSLRECGEHVLGFEDSHRADAVQRKDMAVVSTHQDVGAGFQRGGDDAVVVEVAAQRRDHTGCLGNGRRELSDEFGGSFRIVGYELELPNEHASKFRERVGRQDQLGTTVGDRLEQPAGWSVCYDRRDEDVGIDGELQRACLMPSSMSSTSSGPMPARSAFTRASRVARAHCSRQRYVRKYRGVGGPAAVE